MDRLDRLLLDLYRAAQAMPSEEFSDFALVLLRKVMPFDSARVVLQAQKDSAGLAVQGVHLYNEPTDMVLDWVSIIRLDTVLHTALDNPGQAWRFHTRSVYADRALSVLRDYAERYRHLNSLVIAHMPDVGKTRHGKTRVQGISLFRADADAQFSAEQVPLLAGLTPHLLEALAINRTLALARLGKDTGRGGVALLGGDGLLAYCDTAFQGLMREEWPDWQGLRLPAPFWQVLTRSGNEGYVGAAVRFTASRIGALLFLRGEKQSRLARLSPREAAIAHLYGEGRSYKEIARQLDLSPTTVRNYLARVYDKLEIGGKTELAKLLARGEIGGG